MRTKLYLGEELNAVFNSNINNRLFFNKVSIDSREVKNRAIFFAIKGNNDDGHRYVKKVITNKNNLAVISKNFKNKRLIRTQNTLEGLRNLASYARQRSKAKILAITGSCGKTSLKNLLNSSLSRFGKTHCSPKSFNNHFGAPYSLANLNSDDKFGIFELGMSSKGEIDNLVNLVKPNIAIITNIGPAHLENFQNISGICKAKAESVHYYLNHNIKFLKNNFRNFKVAEGRGNEKHIKINNKKIILINDSYNSNPMSLNEAIHNFSLRKKNKHRKILIVGDMLELGKRSKYYHQQAAKILNKTNIDKVYCIGSEVRHTYQKLNRSKRGMLVKNISFLKENIFNLLENNDILLVKSSNRIGLFNFFKKF